MTHDPFEAWRYRDFRFFVMARFSLTMGILMQSVIVGWLVYNYTKDPWQLGLVVLMLLRYYTSIRFHLYDYQLVTHFTFAAKIL